MEAAEAAVAGSQEKFDGVSLEFRQIIRDHLRQIKSLEQDDSGDLERYERIEEVNRQNLNIIAYSLAFLIYRFEEVDVKTQASNISWAAKQLMEALTVTDKGRKLDKSMYYQLREKTRDYLKSINTELTRIDDQPMDVWQHSYESFDRVLKKLGVAQRLKG